MCRYKAVLFDLDGTVLDTSEGILISIKDAINELGLRMLSDEELMTFIGPPIEWSFADKYGLEGEELTKACYTFRDCYANKNLLIAKPYEGIFELLDYFRKRNIPTAIATYKKQDYATTLLEHFGFDKYVDYIYGSDYGGKLRKSDIINMCIESMNVKDNTKVLMVGDSKHDAMGAKAIGVDFVGCSFGFGFERDDNIKDYDHVDYINKPLELLRLFEQK